MVQDALFAQGDFKAAASANRRGLTKVPDVVDRPIDIARQYGDQNDLREHIDRLQSFTQDHPEEEEAWFLLGYVMYSVGQPGVAADAWEKALAINTNDTQAAILRDAARRVTGTRDPAPPTAPSDDKQ